MLIFDHLWNVGYWEFLFERPFTESHLGQTQLSLRMGQTNINSSVLFYTDKTELPVDPKSPAKWSND